MVVQIGGPCRWVGGVLLARRGEHHADPIRLPELRAVWPDTRRVPRKSDRVPRRSDGRPGRPGRGRGSTTIPAGSPPEGTRRRASGRRDLSNSPGRRRRRPRPADRPGRRRGRRGDRARRRRARVSAHASGAAKPPVNGFARRDGGAARPRWWCRSRPSLRRRRRRPRPGRSRPIPRRTGRGGLAAARPVVTGGPSRPRDARPGAAGRWPRRRHPRAGAGAPQPAADVVKGIVDATVYLKVQAGRVGGSGSGFVIQSQGDTALIATNDHVVNLRLGGAAASNGGGPGPALGHRRVPERGRAGAGAVGAANVIAADREGNHDLAILRVRGVGTRPGRSSSPAAEP